MGPWRHRNCQCAGQKLTKPRSGSEFSIYTDTDEKAVEELFQDAVLCETGDKAVDVASSDAATPMSWARTATVASGDVIVGAVSRVAPVTASARLVPEMNAAGSPTGKHRLALIGVDGHELRNRQLLLLSLEPSRTIYIKGMEALCGLSNAANGWCAVGKGSVLHWNTISCGDVGHQTVYFGVGDRTRARVDLLFQMRDGEPVKYWYVWISAENKVKIPRPNVAKGPTSCSVSLSSITAWVCMALVAFGPDKVYSGMGSNCRLFANHVYNSCESHKNPSHRSIDLSRSAVAVIQTWVKSNSALVSYQVQQLQ
jgi:hypothetical protein